MFRMDDLLMKLSELREVMERQVAQSGRVLVALEEIDTLVKQRKNFRSTQGVLHGQAAAMPHNEKPETVKEMPVVLQFPTTAGFIELAQCCLQVEEEKEEKETVPIKPILAPEGTPLPDGFPDLRPMLRRDGLILLSWKRLKPKYIDGAVYEVFWMARSSRRRVYGAKLKPEDDISQAMPTEISRWVHAYAGDRCRWNDPTEVIYWVYVAPEELVLNGPDPRPEYIKGLETMGIDIGSDVNFTLAEQQRRAKANAV